MCCVFDVTDQKPDVMYADIGGMDIQKQEVREAVELPLTHFELYKQVRVQSELGTELMGISAVKTPQAAMVTGVQPIFNM